MRPTIVSATSKPRRSARPWRRVQTVPLTRGHLVLLLRKPLMAALHACLIVIAWFSSFAIRLDFGFPEPYRGAQAASVSTIVGVLGIVGIRGTTDFPRAILLFDFVLTFLLIGGVRFVVRAYAESFQFSGGSTAFRRILAPVDERVQMHTS